MKGKILIADDEEEIRDLLRFSLEGEHYQVIETQDGEKALEKIKSEKPDLIILDVMMPKITGYEVCEKVRSDGATCLIPIIMLTSLTQTKDKVTGIKLGADEYLTKPFEPFELTMRVEGLLKRTRESIAANPLTGLPGNISIEAEIKRRLEEDAHFTVIYLDANNFKAYNDKHGHSKGDELLRQVTQCIEENLRAYDKMYLYRYGGEEFVLLIPYTTTEDGGIIAERLRNRIKEACKVTVSIGVSHYREISDDIQHLIEQADQAMYEAKKAGKDRVMVYEKTSV